MFDDDKKKFVYMIDFWGTGLNCTKTKMHEVTKLHEGTKLHKDDFARE